MDRGKQAIGRFACGSSSFWKFADLASRKESGTGSMRGDKDAGVGLWIGVHDAAALAAIRKQFI